MLLPFSQLLHSRGWIHFIDTTVPAIHTEWEWNFPEQKLYFPTLDMESCTFSNPTITEFPLFKTFDINDIKENYLPTENIPYRNQPNDYVNGAIFEKMIQNFFKEILQKKAEYADFTILKDDDFNLKKQAGLIIVKCKHHPFVIKLFMETPRSFMQPFSKGFIPFVQFGVGGGATRHLTGFTRIKNSKTIIKMFQHHPDFKNSIEVPRKWYWLPEYPWIKITATNLGKSVKEQSISLPGAYMLITDYIQPKKVFSLRSPNDRKQILEISNFLEGRVDPHINNFFIEKNTNKLVIIDTEHFPTLTGLRKPMYFNSYAQFYGDLTLKFLRERVFCLKKQRVLRRTSGYTPFCTP